MEDEGAIVGARSFEALEREFTEAIRRLSPEYMRRTWVLVPTNLLALHLRRAVASRTGGLMGIKFLTLRDAAAELARRRLVVSGLRPVPEGAEELFLRTRMQQLNESSYFFGLRHSSNTPLALLRAIRVLENALWSPQKLRAAAGEIDSGDRSTPRKLAGLAALWAELRQWKKAHGLFDADDLLREASESAPPGPEGSPELLFLYGFYDLTSLQQALVRRAAGICRRCQAFLLWAEDESGHAPGFEYARPMLEFLMGVLGADTVLRVDEAGPGHDLDRVRRGVFADHAFLDDDEARAKIGKMTSAFDGSVRVLSCPGEFPEALEVGRETLRALEASPEVDSRSVGVLVRTASGTSERLKEAFDRAGLPPYLREGLPLKNTVPGRVLMSLLDLAGGEAARSDVVEFLSLAEIEWPEGLSATAVDRLARAAGIVRGRPQWSARLKALAASLALEAERAEAGPERDAAARETNLCQTAAGFLEEFLEDISRLAQTGSWEELSGQLAGLMERYAPGDAPGCKEVRELVRALAALEASGSAPDTSAARWLLACWLSEKSLCTDRFQRGGVTVSSLMGSRGTVFDAVIVPGLCENGFPLTLAGDPILTEPDRESLSRLAERMGAGALPMRARRPLEERYLFSIALGCARERIVLCYPRMEDGTGRARIPSRFVLNACAALLGFSFNAELLETELPPSLFRRARAGEAAGDEERRRLALDLREHDLQAFVAAPEQAERVAYAREISPCFTRAVLMENSRWKSRQFGPYDGKIRCEELLQRLQGAVGRSALPVSPSQFETYARCPFRYFLKYVLKIEEMEEPAEEYALSPRERGRVMHRLLHRVYGAHLAHVRFRDVSDSDLERIRKDADGMVDEVAESYPQSMPASWAAEREDALEWLLNAFRLDRSAHPDASPRFFEFEFGLDSQAPPLSFAADADTEVRFAGRIDRIDTEPEDSFRIVDYKTGTSTRYSQDSFRGGTQLQLPLYLLAAKRFTGAKSGSAEYLFVSEPRLLSELTLEQLERREKDLRSVLRLILEGIRGGDFFMLPEGKEKRFCREHCDFRLVCGLARERIGQIKASDPALKGIRKLWEID